MSTKEPIRLYHSSINHVNHTVINLVSKNVSKYVTSDAKKAFNQLWQAFTKAPILQYFNLKQYILAKTDTSMHAIGEMLSQLTNDSGWWHPLAYFLHKMISAKTQYKTYNGKLLAIDEVFKIWRHYLEGYKHKVFVFIDYNNFYRFMNTKSLSSCQVWWAQKLSRYYFQINYCQRKANKAADASSHFPQQDNKEKASFWAEKTQILYCLQSLLTNASISGLNTTFSGFLLQHRVLICGIYALPQLRRF